MNRTPEPLHFDDGDLPDWVGLIMAAFVVLGLIALAGVIIFFFVYQGNALESMAVVNEQIDGALNQLQGVHP